MKALKRAKKAEKRNLKHKIKRKASVAHERAKAVRVKNILSRMFIGK